MAAELKQFPLEANRGVDTQTGLLCDMRDVAVNFEPMRVQAGEQLIPLQPGLEFQVAVYSPEPDPQYIYTYSYPPEANLTKFCPDKSVFQWKAGSCLFSEAAYVRLMLRTESRQDGTALADFFRWEEDEGYERPLSHLIKEQRESLSRLSDESEEELPGWIAEEAERVAKRVQQCRRRDDLVFFLLSDIHYTIGCNWPCTAASLAVAKQRIKPDGIIELGDITDGLLPAEWTQRYAGRVLSDIKTLGLTVFCCLGNHDRNFFRGNTQGLSLKACSQLCLGRDDPDYCIEYPDQRLRMIFLDSFDPERQERYGFSVKTLRHLLEMLDETPYGWRVLVFSHVPPLARLHVWSNTILGSEDAMGLINKFRRKRGIAVSWIHGHNHADQVFNGQGFPIISLGCSKLEAFPEYKPEGSVTRMRRWGEPIQELWDVLVFHTHGSDFDLIRYGAGPDRYVRMR